MKRNLSPAVSLVAVSLLLIQASLPLPTKATATAGQVEPPGASADPARLGGEITVHAASRGNPWINVANGRPLLTSYRGSAAAVKKLEQNRALGLSLASSDFDRDGIPDLVCGYAAADGTGIIALHRGNVDSIHPNNPEARLRRRFGRFTGAPFLAPARVFELPEAPEFLGVGDFDGDGFPDVVSASSDSASLLLMSGDGQGGLGEPEQIELPGRVTALAVGEINRPDGLADIVVAVNGSSGPRALVFEGPRGALRSEPETIILSAEATSLAIGQLDDVGEYDLAIAAGTELLLVGGRDRKLYRDEAARADVSPAKTSTYSFPFDIAAIALGDFARRRDHGTEIAVMSGDGRLQYLERWNLGSAEAWQAISEAGLDEQAEQRPTPGRPILASVRVSSLETDDLLAINGASHQIHIVSGGPGTRLPLHQVTSLDVESAVVAALSMRLSTGALSDLVILEAGRTEPSIVMIEPVATFTVINTNDGGTGSFRQAILDANANPGLDMITFSIGTGGVRTIRLASPLPEITDALTIDATTQPGFAGTPIIELDGSNVGTSANGLVISAGNSSVKGLAIGNFTGNGVSLRQQGNNAILNNFIGTDAGGQQDRGNTGEGVNILNSNGNTIFGNTIVFNGDGGSVINSNENIVQANNLGTDPTGARNQGNTGAGFGFANASNNTFEGNLARFNRIGFIGFGGTANLILANDVLDNDDDGIRFVGVTGSAVGSTDPQAVNRIGRNGNGVSFINSMNNFILGNDIGTDTSNGDLGNGGAGVMLDQDSAVNLIGGTVETASNTFAFNGIGILAQPGTFANAFIFNRYFDNGRPISLIGNANGPQPPPVIDSAIASDTDTVVRGTVQGAPNMPLLIQGYLALQLDPSGEGGGSPIVGFTVTPDLSGIAQFTVPIPKSFPDGSSFSALATRTTGDTSEFSAPVEVVGIGNALLEFNKTGPQTLRCTDEIEYTITVRNVGTTTVPDVRVVDLLPECLDRDSITASTTRGLTSVDRGSAVVKVTTGNLDPGNEVTIVVRARLTRECGPTIENRATLFVGGLGFFGIPLNPSVATRVACTRITDMEVKNWKVVVRGEDFERGDEVEINEEPPMDTKFKAPTRLAAQKGAMSLRPCDTANPDRMNKIEVIRGGAVVAERNFPTCR